MKIEPQREHKWLQRLLGDWTFEHDGDSGVETVRSIGGLWIVGESRGELPEAGPHTAIVTLGYDVQRRRYVGSYIGSMMTHLWVYDGALDETGRILTLDTSGPSMTPDGKIIEGKTSQYQDIHELKNDDERTLTSRVLLDDGRWIQFMSMTYRRKK